MRRKGFRQYALFTLAFLVILFFRFGVASADIDGMVLDPHGQPVEMANVTFFQDFLRIGVVPTDASGLFAMELDEGYYVCQVYAGLDYLPSMFRVNGSVSGKLVSLQHGDYIDLKGDLQYIDSEVLPLQVEIFIKDSNGAVINSTGFPLKFGTDYQGFYKIFEMPLNIIPIPADQSSTVSINSTYLIATRVVTRGLEFDIGPIGARESNIIDLRFYTLITSERISRSSQEALESRLAEMEGYGFYLARQETALATGVRQIDEAKGYYDGSEYAKSFDSLKRGYLLFVHTNAELDAMYREASFSVFVLMGFLAVSSFILGYLVTDEPISRVIVDVLVYTISLTFFYFTYPGSNTIPLNTFALVAMGFLLGFTVIGRFFPNIFRIGSSDERVHTRNLVAPIFNLAKRSLRRRKLRFLLTLVSLTLLVMSFVTLTSFSEGYGVITGSSQPKSSWNGVFIRDGSWVKYDPTFLSYDTPEEEWLLNQDEVQSLYVKAENLPLRGPMFTFNGVQVYGVIGGTATEFDNIGLGRILISGSLPLHGVLISESFSEESSIQLGEYVSYGGLALPVDGIFEDSAFSKLRDLDGTPYLSEKWVNISPEGENPTWVIEEVETSEQMIINLDIISSFPLVGVRRIGFSLESSFSGDEFAERLALERGYLAYSSTDESFSFYRLGNYFEGKGASLIIPWVIVVLNVVVTMLNSMFERRKEIEILSSVGLNPAQVSAIFVAEATITGFIAGGLGYLAGLGVYKGLAYLNIGLQVHQKVSAVWSLASIGLAISAVLTGAYAALRNSTVITPSLMRRWRIDRSSGGFDKPWKLKIPIILEPEEVDPYLEFMEERLQRLTTHPIEMTSRIKFNKDERRITFIYRSVQASTGKLVTLIMCTLWGRLSEE
jgi:ABC-type antimicrobial peptide transport system permease subunit